MAISSVEKNYLIALCAEDLFGFGHINGLYSQYRSFEKIYKSDPEEWQSITKQTKERWLQQKAKQDKGTPIQTLEKNSIGVLTFYDDEYPELLKQISSPPVLLYYQGSLDVLQTKSLAIVGTRMISSYGEQVIEEFVPALVSAGLTITSGFQRGIDQAAHKAALASGGKTIAVLGTGIDVDYPSNSRSLRHKIIDSGSLIMTEYPMGTVGFKANFPRRNRIVSGLSVGVLVVEAALKSGSMITPRFALEQNREVFAVPGAIFSRLSEGPHYLIQQGAKCTHTTGDILSELHVLPQSTDSATPIVLENDLQKRIYEKLSRQPSSIDTLSIDLNYPVETLGVELTLMEVGGIIRIHSDGTYMLSKQS